MLVSLASLVLILVVVNVSLQSANRALFQQVAEFAASGGPPPGSRIPSLHGQSPLGEDITVGTTNHAGHTLLLVFSPVCQFCAKTLPFWRHIIGASPKDTSVVYVDISDSADESFVSRAQLPAEFKVLRLVPAERIAYNMRLTPLTILLDHTGQVQVSWAGVLTNSQEKGIDGLLKGSP